MRKASRILGLVICIFCICFSAAAQKNQLSADFGVKLTPSVGTANTFNGATSTSNTFAFELNFAHQIHSLPFASLQIELPYIFTSQTDLKNLNLFTASGYSAQFLTPSLKLQGNPNGKISPWISAGAGFARLKSANTTLGGTTIPQNSTIKPAYQGGGGVDFKLHKLTFRVEGRELYAGPPNLNVSSIRVHHNIMVAAGLVLNF